MFRLLREEIARQWKICSRYDALTGSSSSKLFPTASGNDIYSSSDIATTIIGIRLNRWKLSTKNIVSRNDCSSHQERNSPIENWSTKSAKKTESSDNFERMKWIDCPFLLRIKNSGEYRKTPTSACYWISWNNTRLRKKQTKFPLGWKKNGRSK